MALIVLINPEFKTSFWNFNHSLKIFGRKAVTPTSALPLLAALTPPEYSIVIMDEAVEPLDYDLIQKADIVGMTGMIVQRERMRAIARRIKELGKFLVIGGPWITVQERDLQGYADVIFVGEADVTWPQFLKDWENGCHLPRYEQTARTDMTQLPAQRLDLLKLEHYLQGSIQMSRGCPFLCEFCDIIVTFGRQPRVKTPDQIITELDAWKKAGVMAIFLVDDNIIGNRKALIPILHAIADWQRQNAYLVSLNTEASINLAEDDELLELFVLANIRTVFIGIETPNPDALLETRKIQNLGRKSKSQPEPETPTETDILRRVHKVQSYGIKVTCGLIVGFDSDTVDIFDQQRAFIHKSGITQAMVGLLSAIPKTPLYDRLIKEERLDLDDLPAYGTNVIPKGMSRNELAEGYLKLLEEAYEPEAFFSRLDDLYVKRRFYDYAEKIRVPSIPRWLRIKYLAMSLLFTSWLFMKLFRYAREDGLRWRYLHQLRQYARHKPYPMRYFDYVVELACHYHLYRLSKDMVRGKTGIITTM